MQETQEATLKVKRPRSGKRCGRSPPPTLGCSDLHTSKHKNATMDSALNLVDSPAVYGSFGQVGTAWLMGSRLRNHAALQVQRLQSCTKFPVAGI